MLKLLAGGGAGLCAFVGNLHAKRRVVWELSKRDFSERYASSVLGIFWAYFEPLFNFLIIFLLFGAGLKAGAQGPHPYMLHLFSGMIVYHFINQSLGQGTRVIQQYAFLIKRVEFPLETLAVVKLNSAFFVHVFFVLLLLPLVMSYGFAPGWIWLQLGYYVLCMAAFCLGVIWITSSLNVFTGDVTSVVSVTLRSLYWLTPIIWHTNLLPERFRPLLDFNPLFYLVDGYRKTLLDGTPFWQSPSATLIFWATTLSLLLIGMTVHRRLRPHFAEAI